MDEGLFVGDVGLDEDAVGCLEVTGLDGFPVVVL